MLEPRVIILEYLCPCLGMIMANLMFSAPYKDAQRAVRHARLGDLNPTPWAFMLGNCYGWVFYALLQQNIWILLANGPGFLLSVWLNLSASKVMYQQYHDQQTRKSLVHFLESSRNLLVDPTLSSSAFFIPKDNGKNDNESNKRSNHQTARIREQNVIQEEDEEDETTGRTDIEQQPLQLQQQETRNNKDNDDDTNNENQTFHDNNGTNNTFHTTTTNNNDNTNTTNSIMQVPVIDWMTLIWNVTSQTTPAPAPHEQLVMIIVTIWTCVTVLVVYMSYKYWNNSTSQQIVGTLVNLNLVFFYGAPLSTIVDVVKTKSCNSIHVPTMITNTLNGTFWTAYGIAVVDWFVAIPNGLGALLGGIQILLCCTFPRLQPQSQSQQQ